MAEVSENIYLTDRSFKPNCDILNIPNDAHVTVTHVVFKGLALNFFLPITAKEPNLSIEAVF